MHRAFLTINKQHCDVAAYQIFIMPKVKANILCELVLVVFKVQINLNEECKCKRKMPAKVTIETFDLHNC